MICPACFLETFDNGVCASCGFDENAQQSPLLLPPGTPLMNGQYLVGKILGKPGGFGITYKAYDIETSKICAIKEYLPGFLNLERKDNSIIVNNSNDKIKYKHGEKRFGEEIEILYRIKRYPHIVQILDDFYENNKKIVTQGNIIYLIDFLYSYLKFHIHQSSNLQFLYLQLLFVLLFEQYYLSHVQLLHFYLLNS